MVDRPSRRQRYQTRKARLVHYGIRREDLTRDAGSTVPAQSLCITIIFGHSINLSNPGTFLHPATALQV